jgi:hypothetical protein
MVYEEQEEENIDTFDGKPEELRENDEISDAEEAFLEGYEQEPEEEEEKEEKEEEEFQ